MIGKFFGFTGPMVLLGLPERELEKATSLLNNSTDKTVLKYLRLELNKLNEFLNKIPLTYKDGADNRLANEVKRSELFYKTNGEKGTQRLSQEELIQAKQKLAMKEKFLASVIILDGVSVELTDAERSIIMYMFELRTEIQEYLARVKIDDFKELSAFGFKLVLLKEFKSITLTSIIVDTFKRLLATQNRDLLERQLSYWREDLELLRSRVKDDSEDTKVMGNLSNDRTLDIFRLKSMLDKGEIVSSEYDLGESLSDMGLLDNMTLSAFRKVCDIYIYGRKLTVDYYNSTFGLNLTKEEYDEVFDSLCEKGLVGLNLYFDEMFFDSIKTLALLPEIEIYLERDKNSDLFQFMYEMELFLSSFVKVGDDIVV